MCACVDSLEWLCCVCIAASHDSYGLDDNDDVGDDAMPTRADDTAAGVIDTVSAAAAGVDLGSIGTVDVPTGVCEFMRAGCASYE